MPCHEGQANLKGSSSSLGLRRSTLNGWSLRGCKAGLHLLSKQLCTCSFSSVLSLSSNCREHKNMQAVVRGKRLENNEVWEQLFPSPFSTWTLWSEHILAQDTNTIQFFIIHRLWDSFSTLKAIIHGELEPKARQRFPDSHLDIASSLHLGRFSTMRMWPAGFW